MILVHQIQYGIHQIQTSSPIHTEVGTDDLLILECETETTDG